MGGRAGRRVHRLHRDIDGTKAGAWMYLLTVAMGGEDMIGTEDRTGLYLLIVAIWSRDIVVTEDRPCLTFQLWHCKKYLLYVLVEE